VCARRRSTMRRWLPTGRRTLGRRLTAVEVGRTVAPPSSTTVSGVETSRLATSRETSTCMHQWVRAEMHMRLSPWLPTSFGGVHGAGPTPTYGGLATQVSAPPAREVRRDSQPHRVTAGLLHLHPRGRGNEAVMANYFPVDLTRTARSWLMNLPEGTLHSWSELCHQFMANFESAYARPGNETDLHAIQQRLEKPCAPSSSGSLRFAIPLLVSPMLL
jgi:hypothetical protein